MTQTKLINFAQTIRSTSNPKLNFVNNWEPLCRGERFLFFFLFLIEGKFSSSLCSQRLWTTTPMNRGSYCCLCRLSWLSSCCCSHRKTTYLVFPLIEPFASLLTFSFFLSLPSFNTWCSGSRGWGFMIMGLKKTRSIAGKAFIVVIGKRVI